MASLLTAAGPTGTSVVGSRGLGGLSGLLLGSVGRRVAGLADVPVVVVRGEQHPPIGVVAVGVRDEDDMAVVRFAAVTARCRKASLRLLSAWTSPQYLEGMTSMLDEVHAVAEAEATASARIVGPVRDDFPDLALTADVIKVPSPAGALVDATAHADLLVIGARRTGHPLDAHLGRVTHRTTPMPGCRLPTRHCHPAERTTRKGATVKVSDYMPSPVVAVSPTPPPGRPLAI